MLSKADVVSYFYLRAGEALQGEKTGRKLPPSCIAITNSKAGCMRLFPITSQPPADDRDALLIQEIECRRSGLKYPSWIIRDERNVEDLTQLYNFESLTPIGQFSPGFDTTLTEKLRLIAEDRKLKLVNRT